MNKRIYIVATVIALLGAAALWAVPGSAPPATAATGESHSGHVHEREEHSPPVKQEDLDHLFEKEEHEEAGHGHAETERGEVHAGHNHDGHAEEPPSHAGHDHGGHGEHDGTCPEHRVPEAVDALCHGDHLGELQPGEGMLVRLATADAATKAGVGLSRAQALSLAGGVEIPGRAEFNRNRLARITPLAAGVVRQVRAQPGARVAEGEILAELALPEMAALKAELAAARAREAQAESTYLREKELLERGITSRQEYQQAEAEHRAARSAAEQYRQQLLHFGLSPAAIERLDGSAVLPLRAPFAGTVVAVETAIGETAAAGAPLFTVADLDRLWIELSLPESRIDQARVGAAVEARFDALPGLTFGGRIFQVGAAVDERTRALKALAEVENPEHRLKVGMFGRVRLLTGEASRVPTVPAAALQSIDGLSFLFVQREPDLFELRRVQAGAKQDGLVPILAGLSAGEPVVTSQGFALKSEVLKARLGASCADH